MTVEPSGLLPIASTATTRREALRLFGRRRWMLAATVVVLLAGTASTLAAPALLGAMVDVVVDSGPARTLVWLAAALVATAAFGAVLSMLGNVMMAGLCEPALADLREDVFDRVAARPQADVERAGIGDVVGRVSGDVDTVRTAVSGVLPAFTSALFTIVVTIGGMGLLDARFALAAVVAAPIQVFALRWFLRRSGPVYRAERIAEAERGRTVLEAVTSAETAKAVGTSDWHLDRVDTSSLRAIELRIAGVRLLTHFYNRLNVAELVGLVAVLAVGFRLVGTGAVSVGAATAAALYFHRLFDPISVLLSEFDGLQRAAAGLARLFGVTTSSMAGLPESAVPVSSDRPAAVAVRDVRFSYGGGRAALDGVSLHVAPGEHVALVGASGAGKSTLASMIAGVHPPDHGTVAIGGTDVQAFGAAALRAEVVLVSQEIHVFAGTVADDLRLAHPDATDDELTAAMDVVGAGWLYDLPDGLATLVGTGGTSLTGERSQQLALARLVLKDPQVAVLDEATAEAGSGSSAVLDQAAEAALAGRTVLIVAHRLSQAAAADRVIVLADGRIVEDGPHEVLVRAGGTYAQLWSAWARTRDLNRTPAKK